MTTCLFSDVWILEKTNNFHNRLMEEGKRMLKKNTSTRKKSIFYFLTCEITFHISFSKLSVESSTAIHSKMMLVIFLRAHT